MNHLLNELNYEIIKIKTKYSTVQECIEKCRDIPKASVVFTTYSKVIYGKMDASGRFELSSRARGSGMFVFKGHVREEEGTVYMIGTIEPKERMKFRVYGMAIAFTVLGILAVMTFKPVSMLFGVFFATVPWLNVRALKKTGGLYSDLVKKVT